MAAMGQPLLGDGVLRALFGQRPGGQTAMQCRQQQRGDARGQPRQHRQPVRPTLPAIAGSAPRLPGVAPHGVSRVGKR